MKNYTDNSGITVTLTNDTIEKLIVVKKWTAKFVECPQSEADMIINEKGCDSFYKKDGSDDYTLIATGGQLYVRFPRIHLLDFN